MSPENGDLSQEHVGEFKYIDDMILYKLDAFFWCTWMIIATLRGTNHIKLIILVFTLLWSTPSHTTSLESI